MVESKSPSIENRHPRVTLIVLHPSCSAFLLPHLASRPAPRAVQLCCSSFINSSGMGFGALRNIIRPLSRTLIPLTSAACPTTPVFLLASSPASTPNFRSLFGGLVHRQSLSISSWGHFNSLTDTRYPKRKPVDKPRRKRASLRPPGPYAWVQYVPGQPISPNNPNEGSVKRRNEKKRMRQRHEFILSEAKKRKAELQEAKRKKRIKSVERKMAAVARERAWQERLVELKRLEEEKKKSMS